MEDLNKSIECSEEAIRVNAEGLLNKPACLNNLGISWRTRFERVGELADVEHAIDYQSWAVELTPDRHLNRPVCLSNLGNSWLSRFERLGELADIERAIDYQSQAVEFTPGGDPDKPVRLNNLGVSWVRRFERLGELADIERAIECHSQAVELTPDGHPDKPVCLSNLGNSWVRRFERLGELVDLERAIDCQSRAVELTSDGHTDKQVPLSSLAFSWVRRFQRLGELVDLERAIDYLSQAVKLTPDGHPNKLDCLNSLGNSWVRRFERLGELADLERAIECQSRAVKLTPDGHPKKSGRLGHLGNSWVRRFQRLGELADVERAIKCQSQAVKLTPDGHPDKPACLNSLGISWLCRFERLGELADLDHSIYCQSQAVELTPDGHPDKPVCLNNLGNSWCRRFQRLGELVDLDHAIDCQSQAVEHTPDGHPDKPCNLNNLGNSWFRRFERLGELADLERAIDCQSQAVELTPDDHPDKPCRLDSLGISWVRRFKQLGKLAYFDYGIDCQSRAVGLTPDSHPDMPVRLNNLGFSRLCRFEQLGELADVDHAIECLSQAVELTPDGHPEKPGYLNNLGNSWRDRFALLYHLADLEKASNAFMTGAKCTAFKPNHQMACARNWAEASTLLERSPLEAYRVAFSLLPRLVWIGQTIYHRYQTMYTVRHLATEAAAWAVSVHLYDLALEWLEQGRSVVWGQTLQLRAQFDQLASADHELAQTLQNIASQLDRAGSSSIPQSQSTVPFANLVSQATHHHQIASKWDELLAKARLLPGFENFMRPLKSKEIKQAAKDGPVVVINTYQAQSDALIISPESDGIIHVPLSNVSEEKLDQLKTQVHHMMGQRGDPNDARGFTRDKPQGNAQLPALIWSDIVEPVLKALGYTDESKRDELPHVTWCTTGAMSFVPLHAAGLYDGVSPNASDLVVSSYTPTLTALLLHREPSSNQAGLVAIGQEASSGLAALPNTVEELKVIRKYQNATLCHQLDGGSATVSATLAAMQENSWVHLACHAAQDRLNPSQSAFHLHDGVLTLEEIARRKFKNKGLAFLSACQTAAGDHDLPDEAAHLAAGMLMVGYPSVIGTMWSIMDEDAPMVADIVYSELLKDGKMDHTRSARALHKAIKLLQEKVGEKNIWRWAAFIHIGV